VERAKEEGDYDSTQAFIDNLVALLPTLGDGGDPPPFICNTRKAI
jgi:hypothetical protein